MHLAYLQLSFSFLEPPLSSGVRCRCEGASASMTFISNNASFDLESLKTSKAYIGPQSWTLCVCFLYPGSIIKIVSKGI